MLHSIEGLNGPSNRGEAVCTLVKIWAQLMETINCTDLQPEPTGFVQFIVLLTWGAIVVFEGTVRKNLWGRLASTRVLARKNSLVVSGSSGNSIRPGRGVSIYAPYEREGGAREEPEKHAGHVQGFGPQIQLADVQLGHL